MAGQYLFGLASSPSSPSVGPLGTTSENHLPYDPSAIPRSNDPSFTSPVMPRFPSAGRAIYNSAKSGHSTSEKAGSALKAKKKKADEPQKSSRINYDVLEKLKAGTLNVDSDSGDENPASSPAPTPSAHDSSTLPPVPLQNSTAPAPSSRPPPCENSHPNLPLDGTSAISITTKNKNREKRPLSPAASTSSASPRQTKGPTPATTGANTTVLATNRRTFGTPIDQNAPTASTASPSQPTPTYASIASSFIPRPHKRTRLTSSSQTPKQLNPTTTIRSRRENPHPTVPPGTTAFPRITPSRRLPRLPSLATAATYTPRDRFLALAQLAGRRKQFNKNAHTPFINAAERAAEAYLREPSESNLLRFLELPKLGLVPALRDRTRPAKFRLDRYCVEATEWPEAPPRGQAKEVDKVAEAEKLVETSRLGAAARVLTADAKVVEVDEKAIDELTAKHPPGPAQPFGAGGEGPPAGAAPSSDDILRALEQMDPDSAPGISSWTPRFLKLAVSSPRVLEFVTTLVGSINAGTAPGRDMLCACRLIPLSKSGGGVRPIAVGETLYRLAMKAIQEKRLASKNPLLPSQLGVKSKGGVEPVVRAFERGLVGRLDLPYTHAVLLDAINAFNRMCRRIMAAAIQKYLPGIWRCAKWAYSGPSDLICDDVILESRQGVRQGDPIGPLLFSIGMRPALEALAKYLGPHRKVLAYLDDIFILSTDDKALDDAKKFFEDWTDTLQLNPSKCKTLSFEEIERNGCALLGTMVGAKEARRIFLRDAVSASVQKISELAPLYHQASLLLLRKCISADLRHLQRTLRTDDIAEEWDPLDLAFWNEVKRIRGRPDIEGLEGIADDCLGRRLANLPAKYGGLDLLSHRDVAPHARAAYIESADRSVDIIFDMVTTDTETPGTSQGVRCGEMFMRQRDELMEEMDGISAAMMLENASRIRRTWLNIKPLFYALRLSDSMISTGLCNRTLARSSRPVCKCGLPAHLLHEEVCSNDYHAIRHNKVRDIIAKHMRHIASTDIIVEPMTGDGSRRNDIGVRGPGPYGRHNIDYDLKIYTAAATNAGKSGLFRRRPAEDTDAFKFYQEQSEKWLSAIYNRAIKNKPESRTDFKPVTMSSGGLVSKATTKEMEIWKKEMGAAQFARMTDDISISLLRSRTFVRGACLLMGNRRVENRPGGDGW